MQGLGMPRHTPQWTQQAQGYLEQAGQTTGAMDREQSHKQVTTQEAPDKTGGGALTSAGSGAMAGYRVSGNWAGGVIGAVVGLGAYLFS